MLPQTLLVFFLLIASYQDLKTTEIKDYLPFCFAIFFLLISLSKGLFLESIFFGLLFYAIGYLLFYSGQWGYGDAAILAVTGIAMPLFASKIFMAKYLASVFIFGGIYIIFYALLFSLTNKKLIKKFKKQFKADLSKHASYFFFSLFALFFAFSMGLALPFSASLLFAILFSSIIFGATLLVSFLRLVEAYGMRKRILAKNLKEGDVLANSKIWVGLTKKQIAKIRKQKKYVWIKEGVRFAPVFLIAFFASFLFPFF